MILQKMKPEYHDYLKYLIEYSYEILKNLDISKQVSFICLNGMLDHFNTVDTTTAEKMKVIHERHQEQMKGQREVVRKIFETMGSKMESIDGSVDSFKELFMVVNMQMRYMAKEMEEMKDSHYLLLRILEEYVPIDKKNDVIEEALMRAEEMRDSEYYSISIKKPPVPTIEMKEDEIITHVRTDNPLRNILDEIFVEEEEEEKPKKEEEVYDGDDHAINFMEWNYKDQEQHVSMKITYPVVEGMSKEKIRLLYSIMEEEVKRNTEEKKKKDDEHREKMMEDFKKRSEEARMRMLNRIPVVSSIEDDLKERERVMEQLRQGLPAEQQIEVFARQFEDMSIQDIYSPQQEADILHDILDMEDTPEVKKVSMTLPNDDEPPEPDVGDMDKGFNE
jgi:hypothetical protein